MKLNSKQLRDIDPEDIQSHAEALERKPLYLILENIYDTYNIGGLFRLADALSVSKIYICGDSEIPPNHKIVKASVGTYKVVPWEYRKTTAEALADLRNENPEVKVYAVEQDDYSMPYNEVEYSYPMALLVGNETYGVVPETLKEVDTIVEIPMWGINKSLNVIVSAAIVSYHIAVRSS